MSMQDPIADMLTRIRNAQQRLSMSVSMPASKLKASIANVLQSEGYITGWEEAGEKAERTLTINLKYYNGDAVIDSIQRVSNCLLYTSDAADE